MEGDLLSCAWRPRRTLGWIPSALIALAAGVALAACGDAASKPPAGDLTTVAPRPSYAKRRALTSQARAAQGTGDWETCARLFETAHSWTDAARCVAHTGDVARGIANVERALTRSVLELDRLRGDPELAPLHRDPRWNRLLADAANRLAAYRGRVNHELEALAHADRTGHPPDVNAFAARRTRVAELVDGGGAILAEDYLNAALVYYRADSAADAARAREFALAALEREPDSDDARWLAAAAEDRRLHHEGKPQKYGTQVVERGGRRVLWNVDPGVSDAERERWSVPSLAEAIAGEAQTPASLRAGDLP